MLNQILGSHIVCQVIFVPRVVFFFSGNQISIQLFYDWPSGVRLYFTLVQMPGALANWHSGARG